MSDKVIQVLWKILAEPEKIQEVKEDGSELFFRFGNQVLSIMKRTDSGQGLGQYGFYVYPRWKGTIKEIIDLQNHDPDMVNLVHYHDGDFPDDDEKLCFKKLYTLIAGKAHGVDDVFDDILRA